MVFKGQSTISVKANYFRNSSDLLQACVKVLWLSDPPGSPIAALLALRADLAGSNRIWELELLGSATSSLSRRLLFAVSPYGML